MRFLFQGDSITDAGRGNYENPYATGTGYTRLLEADIHFGQSGHEVMNCGISGNRVVDLLARWKKDCLNLKPDVLTVLIGVNDVWHELNWENGVSAEVFEQVYRILLKETLAALPDIRMILMGAYVIHGDSTDEKWEVFDREVRMRRHITQKLAEEFSLEYIDLQEVFDKAQQREASGHWSQDGVHPTAAGHKLIAQAWKEAAGKLLPEMRFF